MTNKKFLLPDLGEGLPDATIVEWYVKEGDNIRLDDHLVSMETAKAVVDVPPPILGEVLKLAGRAGDALGKGPTPAAFERAPYAPPRAAGPDTRHTPSRPRPTWPTAGDTAHAPPATGEDQ